MQHHVEEPEPLVADRPAFMVEAFRPAGGPPLGARPAGDATALLGVIDIPGDETTLFVVETGDADRAVAAIRALGLQPIRVIAVRWSTTRPLPRAQA